MQAMLLEFPAPITSKPLRLTELPPPLPAGGEIVVEVSYCAICRTELHLVEGELPLTRLPLIPGHQVVGRVIDTGHRQTRFQLGDRVGLTWLAGACGQCGFCLTGRENLCEAAQFLGWQRDGGYAQLVVALADFALPLPASLPDQVAAPLLGAGVLAHRSLKKCNLPAGARLGLYGFGSAGYLALLLAQHQNLEICVYSRQARHRDWARRLGAAWVGRPGEPPPWPLDGAIIFAADGNLVLMALQQLKRGGTLILAGVHLGTIPAMDYHPHLYYEKQVASVVGASRQATLDFLQLAATLPLQPEMQFFPLSEANQALQLLKAGQFQGIPVLAINPR